MNSQRHLILVAIAASVVGASTNLAMATDLEDAMSKSSNWASQAGDYANHQSNEDSVRKTPVGIDHPRKLGRGRNVVNSAGGPPV